MLKALLEQVIEDPALNTVAQLSALAKTIVSAR